MSGAVVESMNGGTGALTPASRFFTANAYQMTAADIGLLLQFATGASDAAFTLLSAVTAGKGAMIGIQKTDSNSVAVTGTQTNSGAIQVNFASSPATTTFTAGTNVYIEGTAGTWEANGSFVVAASPTSTSITLSGSSFVNAWVSGGTIYSGRITVGDGVNAFAWLNNQEGVGPAYANDTVILISDGTAWSVFGFNLQPYFQFSRSITSIVIPPLAVLADWKLMGQGGGGASGRRGASSSVRNGGSAGAGGSINRRVLPTGIFGGPGTSLTVSVGSGANHGAAVTTDSTNGNNGSNGAATTVTGNGQTISSLAASGGNQGTTSTNVGGASGSPLNSNYGTPGNGGAANTGSNSTAGQAGISAGGGGGAGTDATNSVHNPGNGGAGSPSTISITGGAAGVSGGAAPGNGTGIVWPRVQDSGSGGGGGAWAASSAGQAGGNGADGGGGGGGSTSDNGSSSGAGGDGGSGYLAVEWLYAA